MVAKPRGTKRGKESAGKVNRANHKTKLRTPADEAEDVAQAAANTIAQGLERFTEGLQRFNRLKEQVHQRLKESGRRNISTTR